jgi:hypothetical protein
MCYFLYMASPLTLSEIRSMLPPGLMADLAPSSERATLLQLHPSAKTVAHLLVGACSCDLMRPRLNDHIEDERELRARYQRHKLPRVEIIKKLERHRQGPSPRPKPATGWSEALAGFVAEHARNAGPTLYLLGFDPPESGARPNPGTILTSCSPKDVRLSPGRWLSEGTPVIVG